MFFSNRRMMKRFICAVLGLIVAFGFLADPAHAQFRKMWLSGGALHNWYYAAGAEPESQGFTGEQQDGLLWPAIYRYKDTQAFKGLWLGAKNVKSPSGASSYGVRVVHAGPRVTGANEMFPTEFKLVSRFPIPLVTVDGAVSEPLANMSVDEENPDMAADQMIVNRVNTLLGVTMERRVKQFSQTHHDDYHVIEYTLTNTGNTDADADIELPDQTIEDLRLFKMWRWSPNRESRYVFGNATGWGINSMHDIWGDGSNENFPGDGTPIRASYAWHGYFSDFNAYDNIGGPLLPEAGNYESIPNVSPGDTTGRLSAHQFVGAATLHADASATDSTDDKAQPSTTAWLASDHPLASQNDAYDNEKMRREYNDWMARGHMTPSHAYAVEPNGMAGWVDPSGAPNRANGAQGAQAGGYSSAASYGPYTLEPGESVEIVMAEAAAGLGREGAKEVGSAFKSGEIGAVEKNRRFFQGRDSLYQTFRRAIANYESGYEIPKAPVPPSEFTVTSGGDRITLNWQYDGTGGVQGFRIFRARAAYDSSYTMIAEVNANTTSYDDTTPVRGENYFYYIQAVSSMPNSDGTGRTPTGEPLTSSRYYAQTYTPARLMRPQSRNFEREMRIVPNPLHLGADEELRFGGGEQVDRLGFLNIPGQARIDIFTELGEKVETIRHTDGSGDEFWDLTTSARQTVATGVYIAVVTVSEDIVDQDTGQQIYEKGERVFRKFVVVR
jgi:hypothetical protein